MSTTAAPDRATRREAKLVAQARGHLAAALDACEPTHEAVLELCAAWRELHDPAHLPAIADVGLDLDAGPTRSLRHARDAIAAASALPVPAERRGALQR